MPANDAVSVLDGTGVPEITEQAADSGIDYTIELLAECESTNTLLLARARSGAPHATVLYCERQTGGKGRRGRTWYSAPGACLTFSVLWRFAEVPSGLPSLGMVVALALIRSLEELGAQGLTLKWPNDLLFENRKLGGVLVEWVAEKGQGGAAVMGVGLNVRLQNKQRSSVGIAVADVSEAACSATRARILGRFLYCLGAAMQHFTAAGFAPFRADWEMRQAMHGEQVSLLAEAGSSIEGELLGVADDGALLLRCGGAVRSFRSGDMSLRRA